MERHNNCLHFKREPRGKIVYERFCLSLDFDADYTNDAIIPGKTLGLYAENQPFDVKVIEILKVDLAEFTVSIKAAYHENDLIKKIDRKKLLKIVK